VTGCSITERYHTYVHTASSRRTKAAKCPAPVSGDSFPEKHVGGSCDVTSQSKVYGVMKLEMLSMLIDQRYPLPPVVDRDC
jgi:hypothetical protein